jgi:hypothetical protein
MEQIRLHRADEPFIGRLNVNTMLEKLDSISKVEGLYKNADLIPAFKKE